MASPWLLRSMVCVLALAFVAVCDAQVPVHDLEANQTSWSDLEERAGYYTSDGRWRGGLPDNERTEEHQIYTCTEVWEEGGYCMNWTASQSSDDVFASGLCGCREFGENHCIEWECDELSTARDCPEYTTTGRCLVPLTETERINCICEEVSTNRNYCQEWVCISHNPWESDMTEHHQCIVEDESGQYCYRWRGDVSSNEEVGSDVCECYRREEDHCRNWQCDERDLLLCEEHDNYWCNLEISIGLYGGIGMVSTLIAVATFLYYRIGKVSFRGPLRGCLAFLLIFCLTALPFYAGVAISGGVYGVWWVSLMWGIPVIFVLVFGLITWKPARSKDKVLEEMDSPTSEKNPTLPEAKSRKHEEEEEEYYDDDL